MVHENALMGSAYLDYLDAAVLLWPCPLWWITGNTGYLDQLHVFGSGSSFCGVGFVGVQGLVPGNPARKTHPGHEPRTETYTALLAD